MDVRLPRPLTTADGNTIEVVRNVPDGTTQSELMSRLFKAGYRDYPQSVGAIPEGENQQFPTMGAQVSEQAEAIEGEVPLLNRPSFQSSVRRNALPIMTAVGGPTGLVASSLLAAGGAAAGRVADQRVNREPINLEQAGKDAATAGVGNAAGLTILKGLSGLAGKLFSSPLDDAATKGARFAREQEQKFPLSSAIPGTPASRMQQGSRALLPGELKTQADANSVAQFLNREVSAIQAKGSPVDEAALKGQQFLRQVFEPGETVYTTAFKDMTSALGENTAIQLTNTAQVLPGVAEALKTRGATGALAQQIMTIAKRPASQMTAQQIDSLYGELLKKAGKNPNAIPEMNVLLSALVRDVDSFAQPMGVDFAGSITNAKAVRDSYRELRNIPALERLSKEFGQGGGTMGSRQWFAEMFGNPNGKALAQLRSSNPELYHELADSWLASNISKFSRNSDTLGQALDGKALRGWYEQNADKIKLIMGAPQAKALDNFTNYASLMSGSVARAQRGPMDASQMFIRAGAEGAAAYASPFLMLPSEAGSFVLARGLSDPNSALFRLFTSGVKPSTLNFLSKSSRLSGQAGAKSYAENER